MEADGSEGVQELHFFNDAQSRPAVVEYNGEKYRYIHNLQGDVVGIVDHQGDIAAEYKYDAWGKAIDSTSTGNIGQLNLFRYRGYVYDQGEGWYYLRNRYYHCLWMRFVNADLQIGKAYTLLTHNCFGYCMNSPVEKIDTEGMEASYIPAPETPKVIEDLLDIHGASSPDDAFYLGATEDAVYVRLYFSGTALEKARRGSIIENTTIYEYRITKDTSKVRKFYKDNVVSIESFIDALSEVVGGINNMVSVVATVISNKVKEDLFNMNADVKIACIKLTRSFNKHMKIITENARVVNEKYLIK